MAYDEAAARVIINTLKELQEYVKQNESEETRLRKRVREMLRGLDVHELLCSTE